MTTHTSDGIELEVIRLLCKHQRSSYSRKVLSILEGEAPHGVCSLEIDVPSYTNSARFADDYLLYSFLRKWKGFDAVGHTRDARTVDSWQAAERNCYRTNERIRSDLAMGYAPLTLISSVQRKILQVIGRFPPSSVYASCRWSGGATAEFRRGTLVQEKMCSSNFVTIGFEKAFKSEIMDPLWLSFSEEPTVHRGNRCVQVPKTFSINRMIAAEPSANAFAQQAVGRLLRRLLKKKVGVDLNDQSVNQVLAMHALVDGLATIDLSMASDTLARVLIELLLPPAWADLLETLRSEYSCLNGRWYKLEKFSSMGNAFTFELESLIFWAICSSVADLKLPVGETSVVSVYGDDIVVNGSIADEVVGALRYFGFTVNRDKSYFTGSRFFESCGRHFFDLENVTPVYQKEVVGRDLRELIALHNRFFRWFARNPRGYSGKLLGLVLSFTREAHPKLKVLPQTPNIPGDMGFISNECKPNRNGDYKCRVLMTITDSLWEIRDDCQGALYAYKLRRGAKHSNTLSNGHVGSLAIERSVLTNTMIWGRTVCA